MPAASREHKGIIANPNCAAITALMPLWPIHRSQPRQAPDRLHLPGRVAAPVRRRWKNSSNSTRAYLDGQAFQPKVVPHPYAFNLFSHNTAIDPATGYNDEETKVIKETTKIFEDEASPSA